MFKYHFLLIFLRPFILILINHLCQYEKPTERERDPSIHQKAQNGCYRKYILSPPYL